MSNTYQAYNFLPPISQWTLGNSGSTAIGDVSIINQFIPEYQITTGTLIPLELDINGIPLNLGGTGLTGSTGGFGGAPAAATSFMIMAYAEVVNGSFNNSGIIQMSLFDKNAPVIQEISSNINNTTNISNTYYFGSSVNSIGNNNLAEIFYSIDNTTTPNSIIFYDAKLVKANTGSNANNYILFSSAIGNFDNNKESRAIWPLTSDYFTNAQNNNKMKPKFQFYEHLSTVNPNTIDYTLKSGKIYNPSNITMEYFNNPSQVSGYTNYTGNGNYCQYYSSGYPLNINYIYTPIQNPPIIQNGDDTTTNSFGEKWPTTINPSIYNYTSSKAVNIIDINNIENVINFFSNFSVLPCNCTNNNVCVSNSNYFKTNCNTIQSGIAQYLSYQFIPTSQIKPPPSNITTDYTSTYYNNFTTLPQGITFTPSYYGSVGLTGATGTYPIQLQTLIDTGSTGPNNQSSIISQWMDNPTDTEFQCNNIVTNSSYCGFLDYYDSLYGLAYDYGTCGSTGSNPLQKGLCSTDGSSLCVPNFEYLKNSDSSVGIFKCVSNTKAISTDNFNFYITSNPIRSISNKTTYPQYNPVTVPTQSPNFLGSKKKDTGKTNTFFLIIAIILIILLLVFIVVIITKFSKQKSTYQFTKFK